MHAGIALDDGKGSVKTYDFGHPAAMGDYMKLCSTFNKVASIGALVLITSAYTIGGLILGHELMNGAASNLPMIAGMLSGVYAMVATPSKGVVVERNDLDFREKNQTYEIPLSDKQYDDIKTALKQSRQGLYSLPIYNCSDFVKKALRSASINLPKKVFNTPKSLSKQLSNYST